MVAQITGAKTDAGVAEAALHFFARESQFVLRWIVYGLCAATVLTMIVMPPWGILPATALVTMYLLLMFANYIERRSDRSNARAEAAEREIVEQAESIVAPGVAADVVAKDEKVSFTMRFLKHEIVVIAIGIGVALVLALVLAATKFGGPALLLAGFFLFAYILLLTSPVWMAALEDDIEDSKTDG